MLDLEALEELARNSEEMCRRTDILRDIIIVFLDLCYVFSFLGRNDRVWDFVFKVSVDKGCISSKSKDLFRGM